MARLTLNLVKNCFSRQSGALPLSSRQAIALARQTVRNKLGDGSFPIPTYAVDWWRLCKVTEIADFIDRVGQGPTSHAEQPKQPP